MIVLSHKNYLNTAKRMLANNNIKLTISSIKIRHESIDKLIKDIGENWDNEEYVLGLFLNAPEYCLSHPKVINQFADFLQCINNESLLSEFDLEDVESLYKLNLKTLPTELSQYKDLAHYYNAVLNDEIKRNDVIKKGAENCSLALDDLNISNF